MKVSSQKRRFRGLAIAAVVAGLIAIHVLQSPGREVLAAVADQAGSTAQGAAQPANSNSAEAGAAVYAKNCAMCHGADRQGHVPDFPPLAGIKHQMTDQQITARVRNGQGRMPPFPQMPEGELAALLQFLGTPAESALPASVTRASRKGLELSPQAVAGGALFQQNCAFCHGRDAMGGETGPDLTRSKLVLSDTDGSKISEVVREGRTSNDKRMPAFQFSGPELASLVAFIRASVAAAEAMKGGRRGVDVADLQTGNVQSGEKYFNGAGGCTKCHSATGDLAGIASRYQGLQLEERMLYPRDAKSTVTVTLPSGEKVTGTLAYRDEFTIALRDSGGTYRSWPVKDVRYEVDSPVNAHVELFSRYTDDDIHNLMAYLQTLH
jgi:mono/diheme cytochrome c family protein